MAWAFKYLILDPYKHCTWYVNLSSTVFTISACLLVPLMLTQIDARAVETQIDMYINLILKIIGGIGSIVASIAVVVKTARGMRRKKIARRRRKQKEHAIIEPGQTEGESE